MFGIGMKLALAGGFAVALTAGMGMVVQSIKAGERNRINAELAAQKIELERKADESLRAANARVYAARTQIERERRDYDNFRQSMAEIDADACIVGPDLADSLRRIGSGSAAGPSAAP